MRASAIVLAHGSEPTLDACVRSLLDDGVGEVIVVDNGAAPESVDRVRGLSGVRVLPSHGNLGFAGGCDAGAFLASGDVLLFVNSDARVRPGAVGALVGRASEPQVGLASASVRLADAPERLNSAGNPVHYLMFSWVGSFGEPAAAHDLPTELASISGVAFAIRREVWASVRGFDPAHFAYCEDVDLSLRVRQAGYRVVFEPSAVVEHDYEFARNRAKFYLLERNRLMNLAVLLEARTLALVAPPLLLVEAGVVAVAVRDGWARDKVAGWAWLLSHRREVARRRRSVQSARVVPDAALAPLLRGPLDPPPGLGPAVPAIVSRALARYWRWAGGRV